MSRDRRGYLAAAKILCFGIPPPLGVSVERVAMVVEAGNSGTGGERGAEPAVAENSASAASRVGPGTTFISYAREDAAFVARLSRDLEALGVSIWSDRLILPGARWDVTVQAAIKAAGSMLVVVSRPGLGSERVRDEYTFALDDGDLVVPLLLEPLELPLQLRRLQWVDFAGDYARALAELARRLKEHGQSLQPLTVAAEPEARPPKSAWRGRVGRRALLLAAALCALAGGGAWFIGWPAARQRPVTLIDAHGSPQDPPAESAGLGPTLIEEYRERIDSRSRWLLVKSRWQAAAEDFETALGGPGGPGQPELASKAKFCRGRHALLEGRLGDAELALRASIALFEWAPPHIELADVLTRLGRYAEAHAEARRAQTLEPRSWLARVAEGSVFAAEGKMFDAVSVYESVAALGQFPLAQANLALAYHATLQNDARAAELAHQALARDPELIAALQVLAEQALERSELGAAKEYSQRMVNVAVFSVSAWLVHGDVLLALGEKAAARQALRRALELFAETQQRGAPLARLEEVRQALEAGQLPPLRNQPAPSTGSPGPRRSEPAPPIPVNPTSTELAPPLADAPALQRSDPSLPQALPPLPQPGLATEQAGIAVEHVPPERSHSEPPKPMPPSAPAGASRAATNSGERASRGEARRVRNGPVAEKEAPPARPEPGGRGEAPDAR